MTINYPTYQELLDRHDGPAGSSWGVFDEHPERGMANFAGPDQVRAAADAISTGEVFNLDYPLDAFHPSMSRQRTSPVEDIHSAHEDSFDDVWTNFWPQVSSHVDGLRHRRAHGDGFYNGVSADRVSTETSDLGVQVWAERPIVGRAVLADVERHLRSEGMPIDHGAGRALELAELRATLEAQDVTIMPGDLLLVRTGWAGWFLDLAPDKRERARTVRHTTGLAQSRLFIEWLWNSRIALLGTDTFAVEVLPPRQDSPFSNTGEDHGMMHQELIAKLGCPLGELWHLDELAAACARTGRYSFFASVKPLNLTGGVGSPANSLAIF